MTTLRSNVTPMGIKAASTGTPSFVPTTDYQVRAMTGTFAPSNGSSTLASVNPVAWPSDDASLGGIVRAYSGAFKTVVSGVKKLMVHGGGHADGTNNGVFIFDYSEGTTGHPVGWSVKGQSASPSVVTQEQDTYTDGKPTAIHSYDGLVFANGKGYRVGGVRSGPNGSPSAAVWEYDFTANTITRLGDCPLGNFQGYSVIHDPVTNKILAWPGNDAGPWQSTCFLPLSTKVWSGIVSHGNFNTGLDTVSAWDSNRGRMLSRGQSNVVLSTVNFSAQTITSSFPAGVSSEIRFGRCIFYDAARDSYWAWGDNAATSITSISEIDAGTLATKGSIHPFSGDTIQVVTPQSNGQYSRYCFMPEWRCIGFVCHWNSPAYLIKLPA